MNEEWRDIKGYEGLYQVSNLGRVKSLERICNCFYGYRTVPDKIRKICIDTNGYCYVKIHKNGVRQNHSIHRLVAEAFIPNPNNYPCINHKSEDKTNNRVCNLEWCTVLYNNNYGDRMERISKKTRNGWQSKPVLQCDLDGNLIHEWPSAMECDRNGFCQGHVSACCRGDKKTYKGYIWKYKI